MIRNLLIISGAGLVLAAVGIGGAFAVGGSDLARHSWGWVISEDDDSVRIERSGPAEPPVSRTIEWTGGESLNIDVPVRVIYDAASTETGITVSGPKDYVDAISFQNGTLSLSTGNLPDRAHIQWSGSSLRGSSERDRLSIRINGGAAKAFNLSGHTDLEIRGYNQPSLNLTLVGNADVEVQGTTKTLVIDASGDTSAELDELLTTDATIRTSGDAGVKTSANGTVVIESSGESRVRLTRQPAELRQSLTGEAEVLRD